MLRKTDFFIDGKWVAPTVAKELDVINPADEQPFAVISLGSAADVDKAVAAAQRAFPAWSATSREQRIALLEKLLAAYNRRVRDMAQAISWEMGAPIKLALEQQAASGSGHIKSFIEVLKSFEFEEPLNDKNPQERIVREPIGVCGLITPWNWPMNQVALKVVPALAAGCTVVLKPSEIAPMSSIVFAEMMEEAGFPAGVFNMVNGDGPTVGEAMSRHPGIDMMSFTGSTRAGVAVTKASAETVKRVALELGGKSPNIVFDDADLTDAVTRGLAHCFENTGQSCNAPTRMLVQRPVYAKAVDIAAKYAATVKVGNPAEDGDHIGPLSSDVQFEKVQGMIDAGIKEGARVVAGGLGRPEGFNRGYYVRPTVFADANNDMRIAREEIFGPVVAMIPFETEEEAIAIANDTPYGLSAYVQTGDKARAQRVARKLRAGMVQINGTDRPYGSPFGGYKQSGLGREGGKWGIEDFLEVKAISGFEEGLG
ncbi:aldehyde dehydrogenase family protein [Aminobacter sp. NyZ550]|jgi:aldehyde dehydrogenase (NAD+)|uniref:aldehyde dehydrogenase (NAD(+)) n=1 Tax=Aminobacter ciceronei TaxID=150723 RepID=A0ABR6CDF2_9HYPH|nr:MULTISPECIES: aldehyde dehydrogenase family protein [Aminobacter]WMC96012.1 aldehyde dehydrogenase family protein [Aminobacter aminovorans]MBA8908627.1 aldehyde dehydrogenase (NAD+) [Aminobacter ciceronei]MBA9022437.1 aldehyde dehydrogenase (NAD+) [Aminobacter ciceronei]MRX35583.1 aldehyde dehydrogenase family protein [Aminobacter sp. MDW-2]QNH36210.1 aldehyde dehydrogenase family protein [Aminobacter sp. MDW-2]